MNDMIMYILGFASGVLVAWLYSQIRFQRMQVNIEPLTICARRRRTFDDVIIENREDAEKLLRSLLEVIADYGFVTISDFCDLVGIRSNYTDVKYGWDDLGCAYIIRVKDGYHINLPRPSRVESFRKGTK